MAEKAEIMQHETLAEALLHAQMEYPPLDKTSTVNVKTSKGSYSYTYADLAYTKRMTDPYLWKHGLVIHSKNEFRDGKEFVVSMLIHVHSKERECSEIEVTESRDMKALGANITYARRYNYWNLSGRIGEDDSESRPTERQGQQRERTKQPSGGAQNSATGNKAHGGSGDDIGALRIKLFEKEKQLLKTTGETLTIMRKRLTDAYDLVNDVEKLNEYDGKLDAELATLGEKMAAGRDDRS